MTGPAGALLLLGLLLALVEFGQVWYYPGGEGGVAVTRAFGGAFRLGLWTTAAAGIATFLTARGPGPILATLAPFLPFAAWGAAVALLWSIDRTTGLRALTFWSLGTGVAAAAGAALQPRTLARAVAFLAAGIAAASLALALVRPEAAFTPYGDGLALRGLFPHKNGLGWYCALGLVWTLALRRSIGAAPAAACALILAAGLVAADSRTALAIAAAAAGYLVLTGATTRALGDGAAAAAVTALALAAVAAAVILVAPLVLDAVGRDVTLTGRTEVWRHYLGFFRGRMLTGLGTGLFSTDTSLNVALGGSVPGAEGQGLHSPHNTYIGLLGEAGLPGVAAFAAAHLWLLLVAPFRGTDPWLRLSGALALAILLAGLTEMRDAYGPGAATIALVAARAAGLGRAAALSRAAPASARGIPPPRHCA